jgi:anthraniloyl-CoA monooxygenase
VLAPSPRPYFEGISQIPHEITREQVAEVRAQFVRATELGASAGFDMLELHMAHGYLLASFLSPLTNQRQDEFGGDLAGRLKFPLQVLRDVRKAWPSERPMSVRISATDWKTGGLSEDDLIAIARAFKEAGADILDVSTGQTVADQEPIYGRMYQTPFSDKIRNEVGIPTIAVGNIFDADHINSIVAAGRADLCALARPHLTNPFWTLTAAAEQKFSGQWWPEPYLSGKSQLERNVERAAQMIGPV